jgi:hypothetical protein
MIIPKYYKKFSPGIKNKEILAIPISTLKAV